MSAICRLSFVVLLAVTAAGCGGANSTFTSVGSAIKPGGSPAPVPAAAEGAAQAFREAAAGKVDVANEAVPVNAEVKPPAAEPVERKIVYTAHLDVVVKDLDAAIDEMKRLTAADQGYVAKSEVRGDAGSRRTAAFTLRVPVANFPKLVDALAALGTPERNATDSQDVTEEFVDVQARLKNLRAEEETLNKLLTDRAVRLEDVLKIRDQIKGVRGEIERAEGRLKYLSTVSALSTVNLSLREIKDYRPPTAPTFGDRAGRAFGGSVEALQAFAEGVALFAVALAPWLPLLLVFGGGLYVVVRRMARATPPRSAVVVRPPTPGEGA